MPKVGGPLCGLPTIPLCHTASRGDSPILTTAKPLDQSPLTPQQQDVISRLCAGHTITAAALALGIHRTTIHQWRRTNAQFALALADAQADRVSHWEQQLESRTGAALLALDGLLADERTPATIRFKAIQLVLQTSLRPNPSNPPAEADLRLRDLRHLKDVLTLHKQASMLEEELVYEMPFTPGPDDLSSDEPIHHNSSPEAEAAADESPAAITTGTKPESAPQTVRYNQPKPGRNEKCPCGSGRKYKQCCLQKQHQVQHAA